MRIVLLCALAVGCARVRPAVATWRGDPGPLVAARTSAAAPVARPLQLGVGDAVAEALAQNRSVLQARLGAAIGTTAEDEARSALRPRLTARGSLTRVDEVRRVVLGNTGSFPVGSRDVASIGLSLDFPIFSFGRHIHTLRAARLARQQAEADVRAVEADIAAAVTAACFDLAEAKEAVAVARDTEAALERQLKDANAQLDAQRVTPVAVLDAEVALLNARRTREKLESAIPIRRLLLNRLLGRPVAMLTRVVEQPATTAPPWQREGLADEAAQQRPEMVSARYAVAAARKRARAAIAAELPALTGSVTYAADDSSFTSPEDLVTGTINLDLPIYTGGGRSARIRRARHEIGLAILQQRELEAQVRAEVISAFRDVTEAWRDIDVAQQTIARAEESLRIQRVKFQNDRATSREVLESTAQLANARFARLGAVYDYNIALRDLQRARGVDPRSPVLPAEGEEQ